MELRCRDRDEGRGAAGAGVVDELEDSHEVVRWPLKRQGVDFQVVVKAHSYIAKYNEVV